MLDVKTQFWDMPTYQYRLASGRMRRRACGIELNSIMEREILADDVVQESRRAGRFAFVVERPSPMPDVDGWQSAAVTGKTPLSVRLPAFGMAWGCRLGHSWFCHGIVLDLLLPVDSLSQSGSAQSPQPRHCASPSVNSRDIAALNCVVCQAINTRTWIPLQAPVSRALFRQCRCVQRTRSAY